jgi:pyruvate-ferredoxin/flavodoxin oxidoreductase
VYVAKISLGANPRQALKAFTEAEAYDGPSLILAYSHCIAHGIDMINGFRQQKLAVECGHWPLFRYNPMLAAEGKNPFMLDSKKPSVALKDYTYNEIRYKMLTRTNPQEAERLLKLGQEDVNARWKLYEQMAGPAVEAEAKA